VRILSFEVMKALKGREIGGDVPLSSQLKGLFVGTLYKLPQHSMCFTIACVYNPKV